MRQDRIAIRNISCQTAFFGMPRETIFDNDEILADALTLYFTDYEPDSCFIAVAEGEVIGYIIGSVNVKIMNRVQATKVIPQLLIKATCDSVFIKRNTRIFLIHVVASFLKGEFSAPDFSRRYPATLHINIDKNFRGRNIGRRLVERYIDFLKEKNANGVHFGTMSEEAKLFFAKLGFEMLFEGRRSYLRYYFKRDLPYYIFGKRL